MLVMHKQASALPICIAVALAALAAIFSAPTMAKNVETEVLLWMLQTQAHADENPTDGMEVFRQVGLP
jgi:hypothetical protein